MFLVGVFVDFLKGVFCELFFRGKVLGGCFDENGAVFLMLGGVCGGVGKLEVLENFLERVLGLLFFRIFVLFVIGDFWWKVVENAFILLFITLDRFLKNWLFEYFIILVFVLFCCSFLIFTLFFDSRKLLEGIVFWLFLFVVEEWKFFCILYFFEYRRFFLMFKLFFVMWKLIVVMLLLWGLVDLNRYLEYFFIILLFGWLLLVSFVEFDFCGFG